jgi:cysteine desulfurase
VPPRIYLDHAATTPMRPEAVAAVADGMARWANPSSPHAEGRAARAALEQARARIAAALGWGGEVILTSGASEAAVLAAAGRRAWASAGEHQAILRVAENPPIGLDGDGLVDPEGLESGEPLLVALQHANSETGVIQPVDRIASAVRGSGGSYLADCAQTAGKLPLPPADLVIISAHKLGGPPGVGALLVRDLAMLNPVGGQERGYRPGTENLPGALGFAAALEAPRDWYEAMAPLRAELDRAVRAAGGEVIAEGAPRMPTIASYRMPGVPATAQLIRLDLAGFSVSAGSACSSGSLKPSHVLSAMGIAPAAAAEVIRVSFGWTTTADEVARFAEAWAGIAPGRAAA